MAVKKKAGRELVLYYTPERSDLDRIIKSVFVRMGVRIRNVDDTRFGQAVGYLAGVPGAGETPPDEAAGVIPERFLVFCGFGRAKLNNTLKELRRAGVPEDVLKAALTMSNSSWSLYTLYKEVASEREQMNSAGKEDES